MRKIIGFLLALCALPAIAQTSAVTASITDPDSTAWASLNGYNATYAVQLVSSSGQNVPPGQASRIDTGATVTTTAQGTMDATGTFTTTIVSSNNITPAGTKWKFTLCPAVTSPTCNNVTLAINASGTYSTQLSAGAVAPRIGGGIGNYAYNDTEVAAIANNSYLNITTPTIRCYSTSWGSCGGGSSPFQSLTTNGSSGAATLIATVLNVPQYSGGGFPITLGSTSIAASSTTTSIAGLTSLQNVQYLSAGSELGAQINTAVTALGNKGVIQLPYGTSLTMTTTATNIPPGISIRGYGKLATIITCSVVGDCFQFLMNPTSVGEIGSEISSFSIQGSNTGQTLMHFNGASGYTIHDLEFQPYPGVVGNTAAVCLEFDNSATGLFTERNRTYSILLERTCTIGALFNQNAGDSSTSFGYNIFEFNSVSQGSNFSFVFNGGGFLYNGSFEVHANHVGPGGGVMQFNNAFATDQALGIPNERLYVTAEENGTGAGTLISCTGSGTLRFLGNVVNGAFNASGTSLATTYGGCSASIASFTVATNMVGDTVGNYYIPSTGLEIGGIYNGNGTNIGPVGLDIIVPTGQTYGGWNIDAASNISGANWQGMSTSTKSFVLYDLTDATQPLALVPTPTTFANLVKTGSNSQFCWGSTAQFANINGTCDTGISRTGADAIALGNGTQGDRSAAVALGTITVLPARRGTFVCTAAGTITISNTNMASTSNVVISMSAQGGTITTPPAFKTVTGGTGFTVLCGASDTSTYNYAIEN